MLNNSNGRREPSPVEIEQLQQLIKLYKKYYNSKDMTMLDAMVAKSAEEFKNAYPEISMERSDEINPLTGCAHGTKASTILAAIMFTKGQLLPKNGVRDTRVFKMNPRKYSWRKGNENFVSAIHFNSINTEDSIKIFNHSFAIPILFAGLDNGVVFDKNVFVKKIEKRYRGKSICKELADLGNNITQIFQVLSNIPVIILGDGVGRFEGNIEDIVYGQQDEVLYEGLNIRIIVVKKEHIPLVSFLAELCPELNIKIVEQEKFSQFTNAYDCKNDGPFIEAVVKHFKLQLAFSEKAEPITLEKRSIYNGTMHDKHVHPDMLEWVYGIVGRVDRVSYYAKNLIEQKQNFYGEDIVKSAIKNSGVIDGYDPIEYALLHRLFLNEKSPVIYAMENRIKINGIDPTLWAEINKYQIEILPTYNNCKYKKRRMNPVNYAIEHNIQIEGLDAKKWMDTIGNKRIEDEKKNRKDTLHSVVSVEQPKQPPVVEEMHQELEIEQPKKSPISTPSSPTVDTEGPKPKSNSKYSYIGACATAGLCIGFAIGCATAYFAGALVAVCIIAAVAGMLVGAAFGAGIGYCVSRCFDNPNVEEHKQLFVSL